MARRIIVLTALVAAALLMAGGLTASWWVHSGEGTRSSIGLREARLCGSMGCTDAPLGKIDQDDRWIRAGAAAHAVALLAGGLLLAVALSVALRRQRSLLTQTALVAVACAGITGLAFVWLAPGYFGMNAGYSMIAYAAGVIAGALGCVLALRSQGRAFSINR
jgi:hypothetical protein